MERVVFRNLDNADLWEIIDKNVEHVLLHQFNPHTTIEWWTSSISLNKNNELKNISVRQMHFDLLTDLSQLKRILELNTLYLDIYQFNRPVPNTLLIDYLPENARENILKQNGLEHIIIIDLEDTIIKSFNADYISNIRQNTLINNFIII